MVIGFVAVTYAHVGRVRTTWPGVPEGVATAFQKVTGFQFAAVTVSPTSALDVQVVLTFMLYCVTACPSEPGHSPIKT